MDTGSAPLTGDPCRDVVLHLARRLRGDRATWQLIGPWTETYERMVRAVAAINGCTEEEAQKLLACVDPPPPPPTGVTVTFTVEGLNRASVREAIDGIVASVSADIYVTDDVCVLADALEDADLKGGDA